MTVAATQIDHGMPRGYEGGAYGLDKLADYIDRSMHDPLVIEDTRQTLMRSGVLNVRGRPDPTKIVRAIFEDQKKRVGFVRDPVDTELMVHARYLLCLDPNGPCVPAGDCDDQVIAVASRVMCAGVPVRLRLRWYKGQGLSHITIEYDRSMRLEGDWVCLDPSREDGRCNETEYEHQVIREVHMGHERHGTFVGMGGDYSGSMGADDKQVTLSTEESKVWVARTLECRDKLAQDVARLRSRRDALVRVRADLGLPAFDPAPAPSSEGAKESPLRTYARTGAWTKEASDDESKLIESGDYAVRILDEGLAGNRPLYFDSKDWVLIGAKPNDPYFILMKPNDNGEYVASKVDPKTGNVTGQMGLIPVVIAVAGAAVVVALSLGAAWHMDKLIDFLAQRHYDDMQSKISDNQTQLIAAGKATPEQLAALQKANVDMANAAKLPKSSGTSWLLLALAAVAGVAAGVGGALAYQEHAPKVRSYISRRRSSRKTEPEGDGAGEAYAYTS